MLDRERFTWSLKEKIKHTIQRTVSHMFVIMIVISEYLLGLSCNSKMDFRIVMRALKGMKAEKSMRAAKIIVLAVLS